MSVKKAVATGLAVGALSGVSVTTPDGRNLTPHRRNALALLAARVIRDTEHADNVATVRRYLGEIAVETIGPDRGKMARFAKAATEIVRRQTAKVPEGVSDQGGDE